MNNPEQITYFAETDARNKRIAFGIRAKDRTKHIYVIGKTGMGKSTLLENMAVQDIRNGNGLCFIDPHGKTAELLLEYIPEEMKSDVLYFAPFDMEFPISFNVMEDVGYDKRHLVVSGLMSTFKKIWVDAWSARMEYILSNTLFALLEYPDSTLLSINKMLIDKEFRKKVVDHITDSTVKSFWVDEFAKFTDRYAAEATPAIQNKIGQFTSNPLIRNIIGQSKSSFDLRKLMDERKIIIVNLSKGRIGETNASLLGSMLITKIYLSAMSRADLQESEAEKLPNFYLFVDEFQSFANESFADILSEARKYKLNLTMAHQYIEQMTEEVRAAVFGNVGTLISFRVGSYDAEVLEKEFAPRFTSQDMVNLGFAQIYLRLMIDGVGSQPFSARTLPPLLKPEESIVKRIIENSRRQFGKPREIVEEEINQSLGIEEKEKIKSPSVTKSDILEKRPEIKREKEREITKNQSEKKYQNHQNHRDHQNQKPVIDFEKKKEILSILENKKDKFLESSGENPIEQESVSLQFLKKSNDKKDTKAISEENKNELKNVLAQVLNDSKKEKAEDVKKAEETAKEKAKEIPEDELKALLEVAES